MAIKQKQTKIMDEKLLEKAALQALCDNLGFEEGKVYFDLLNKKDLDLIGKEYSHSKYYRILSSLQDSGALAKAIIEGKDIAVYIPLPPTFLYHEEPGEEFLGILDYLENLYLKNYREIYNDAYIEINWKYKVFESLFLVKNFMKDYAIIVSGGSETYFLFKKYLPPEKLNKIKFFCRKDYSRRSDPGLNLIDPSIIGNKRTMIVDGKIILEVLTIPQEDSYFNPNKTRYLGYLLTKSVKIKTPEGEVDFIKRSENELRKLLNIKD